MKKGLGRGLESLFSLYEDEEIEIKPKQQEDNIQPNIESNNSKVNTDGVCEVDLKLIDPNKNQPRKSFDSNALKELSESIKQHGVIQPIILNKENSGRFTIIAGERRFRASLIAGKTSIPAIIREYSPKEIKEVSLIENLQREDLNPIEAAKAIKELMNEYDFTQEDVADRIGKSRPLVANTLRLLTLNSKVIAMIEKNQISAGHGKCLVSIEDKERQFNLANIVFENKLSVRDLENYIKNNQDLKAKNQNDNKIKPLQSLELKELNHRITRLFKTKVLINGDDHKGKIIIDYYSKDDLDRISTFISTLDSKF